MSNNKKVDDKRPKSGTPFQKGPLQKKDEKQKGGSPEKKPSFGKK